ncbi:N-acetylmuramoyl-L-alanine amidase [Shouchella miscanthi]|uniref:N-acetylmuramoyl-L-alanine amidase n=1 Tax=Shouchella miscanthi TaxID=2598861 RepID=UPI003F5A0D19
MNIIQDFIPASNGNRPGYALNPTYITIHETANTSAGANAAMHARYVKNPTTAVSWHFTVDDGQTIYQHLPLNENGWHAGDGGSGTGNRQSIGIEICVNRDGDFQQAMRNAGQLTRQLMDQFQIPLDRVVAHQHWSGKRCPANIINAGGIEMFRTLIPNASTIPVEEENNAPAPSPQPTSPPSNGSGNQTTGSIVTYLNSIGVDSSFENRARLASQNGIQNYTGTAEQNTRLLSLLRNGQESSGNTPSPSPAPPPSSGSGNQTTGSIVTYLNSIGVDSSFENRARLATQNGIQNYTGTAEQNTRLLSLVRNENVTPPSNSGNQTTGSIVTYLNSIGVDSSFENRARLARQNGIQNYTGTAAQNTQLLQRLRNGGSNHSSSRPKARQGEGIVDYLNRIGVDSSFSNRSRLASQYGIANYRGTAQQNSRLLNQLSG